MKHKTPHQNTQRMMYKPVLNVHVLSDYYKQKLYIYKVYCMTENIIFISK